MVVKGHDQGRLKVMVVKGHDEGRFKVMTDKVYLQLPLVALSSRSRTRSSSRQPRHQYSYSNLYEKKTYVLVQQVSCNYYIPSHRFINKTFDM